MRYIIKIFVLTVAVYVTGYLLKGVHIDNFVTAILIAFVLSLLNTFLRPILVFFTIPFSVVTFGLFLLVINAAIIMIASWLLDPMFKVDGFWWALFFSIILSFFNSIFEVPFKQKVNKNPEQKNVNAKDDDHFDDYEEVK
jgi:putative membrane protein